MEDSQRQILIIYNVKQKEEGLAAAVIQWAANEWKPMKKTPAIVLDNAGFSMIILSESIFFEIHSFDSQLYLCQVL